MDDAGKPVLLVEEQHGGLRVVKMNRPRPRPGARAGGERIPVREHPPLLSAALHPRIPMPTSVNVLVVEDREPEPTGADSGLVMTLIKPGRALCAAAW